MPLFIILFFVFTISTTYSQSMPILTTNNGSYHLTIPYLEHSVNPTDTQAYAAVLLSSDLQQFTISSAAKVDQQSNPSNTSTSSISDESFVLKMPYIQVENSTKIYSANLSSPTDLSLFSVDTQSVQTVFSSSELDFSDKILLRTDSEQSLAGSVIGSSTKLSFSWSKPDNFTIDHYEISTLEENISRENRIFATKEATSVTLTELKSDTNYSVMLYACSDSLCSQFASAKSTIIKTAKEHWLLQGSGNTVANLTAPIADGNARISATRIGPDAETSNAATVQLYYGPFMQEGKNSTLAVATGNISTDNASSAYLEFTSLAYQAGLISPVSSQNSRSSLFNSQTRTDSADFTYINQVATGQGVPLNNGKLRLFFEANGSDNKTRIFWIDSQDGYLGQDFNSGSSVTCSTESDYSAEGECSPTLAIGVKGDSSGSNSKIRNARQQKVGFPTQSDWRWDMSSGTFMVFTTDSIDGCSDSNMNHAYAVWDGSSEWSVQYESDGCPKLFKSAQACLPMHIGGMKYKMYCGDPSQTSGKSAESSLPFLGPKQLLYADGTHSGHIGAVDFEDWEDQSLVRDVVFLWPDGSVLNDSEEGYIDDYHFLAPTGDLSLQVMYMAITDGSSVPVAATAILQNP